MASNSSQDKGITMPVDTTGDQTCHLRDLVGHLKNENAHQRSELAEVELRLSSAEALIELKKEELKRLLEYLRHLGY